MTRTPDRIDAAAYRARQTEAEFQSLVVEMAEMLGWLVVHIRNTVANPDALPDLLMWRGDDYLLAELKTERGAVTAKQQQWHENAAYRGVTVHVWRPSDWPEIEAALSRPFEA